MRVLIAPDKFAGTLSAVEVAAAGAHHLMLTGPPGIGKTMLAQRLPGLLPELSHDEAVEEVDLAPLLGQCAQQATVLAAERGVAVRAEA